MKSEACNTFMDRYSPVFRNNHAGNSTRTWIYIQPVGRENLLEVTDITTKADYAADFEHYSGETYKAYYIEATWNYKSSSKIDVNSFQKTGYFTVVDNDGRYEIAQFFDHYD